MLDFEKAKLVAELTVAKIGILRLKADGYNWQCHTDEEIKDQLESALASINEQLEKLET